MSILSVLKDLINKSPVGNMPSPFQERLASSRKVIKSLRAKAAARRTLSEKFADWMTRTFGSAWFLILNVLLFTWWIMANTGMFSDIRIFDPFPFGLLTTFVSLEAIVLAIFVLISQNREQKVNDLREEFDLQVDLIAESELTKVMEIVVMIAKKQGIKLDHDSEISEMLKPLNKDKLTKSLEKEIK